MGKVTATGVGLLKGHANSSWRSQQVNNRNDQQWLQRTEDEGYSYTLQLDPRTGKNFVIQLEHLPTKGMTSDIFTKALDPKPFVHLHQKFLGLLAKAA